MRYLIALLVVAALSADASACLLGRLHARSTAVSVTRTRAVARAVPAAVVRVATAPIVHAAPCPPTAYVLPKAAVDCPACDALKAKDAAKKK